MIDKTALYLIDKYIEDLEFLRTYYQKEYEESCKEIDVMCDKEVCIRKSQQDKNEKESTCDICEIISNFEDKKYIILSGNLQNLVSLWENQMNDFYLLNKCKDFKDLKENFSKDDYFQLGKEKNFNLYEMRIVGNYLKHGQFGTAEKDLISIDSKYYNNNGQFGELRGNYYRGKQLNITKDDIEYFAGLIIEFWTKVKSSIIHKG